MRWRTAGKVVAVLAVLTALYAYGPAILLAMEEGQVPPASDVPALPDGVTAAREDVPCGTGGCWRALTLRGPDGQSPAELAASLGFSPEECHARGLLDRRRVCIGVEVVGETVTLHVRFDRTLRF
jgi:hypothetical protein